MIRRRPTKAVSKVEFDCENIVDTFANKGYVVLNQFFSSKLTKLLAVECQALFSQRQKMSHKTAVSSCILEPMNNTCETKLPTDQNNDVKVNQRKYSEARISRSPVHSKDINAVEDILNRVVFSESLKTVLKSFSAMMCTC